MAITTSAPTTLKHSDGILRRFRENCKRTTFTRSALFTAMCWKVRKRSNSILRKRGIPMRLIDAEDAMHDEIPDDEDYDECKEREP